MCRWTLVCWGLCAQSLPAVAQNPPLSAPRLEPIEQPAPADAPLLIPEDVRQFIAQRLFSITVRERFANRWVATETTEEGPIRDCVLGADVVGVQLTRARTELDFVPCGEAARMFLHLHGTTMNRTTSRTPQAVIESEGNYRFQLSKQIDFDGHKVGTRSPAAFLETRQRNLSARTLNAGIPVFGPLISMVAYYAAEQQRPLAERIAAFRLTQSMAPKFNQGVDEQLAGLNRQLQLLRDSAPLGFFIDSHAPIAETTDDRMQVGLGQVAQQASTLPPVPDFPLLIVLHQQVLNDLFDQLSLGGKEFSDVVLDRVLERLRKESFSLEAQEPPDDFQPADPPSFAMVRFVGPRPLRVDISDGKLRLTAVVGFRPVLGPEIPPQRIVLALSPKLDGEQCEIELQLVDVAPADPVAHPNLGELTAALLRQQIEQRLVPFRIPRNLSFPGATGRRGMRLAHLLARDGWLVLGFDGDTIISAVPLPILR